MNFTIDFTNIYNFLAANIITKCSLYILFFILFSFINYYIIFNVCCFFRIINRKTAYSRFYDDYDSFPSIASVCYMLSVLGYIITILIITNN